MLTCTFKDGNTAYFRHLTVVALVLKERQILLAQRAAHLTEGGKWCLPGGYLDRDETAAQGIAREVLEETGYRIQIEGLLHIIDTPDRPNEDRQNIEFCFVTTAVERIQDPDSETAQLQWFSLDALPKPELMAFDHRESIEAYKRNPSSFSLPFLRKL